MSVQIDGGPLRPPSRKVARDSRKSFDRKRNADRQEVLLGIEPQHRNGEWTAQRRNQSSGRLDRRRKSSDAAEICTFLHITKIIELDELPVHPKNANLLSAGICRCRKVTQAEWHLTPE
jgi:hypothetical protein